MLIKGKTQRDLKLFEKNSGKTHYWRQLRKNTTELLYKFKILSVASLEPIWIDINNILDNKHQHYYTTVLLQNIRSQSLDPGTIW